jgi:hypothetical protein
MPMLIAFRRNGHDGAFSVTCNVSGSSVSAEAIWSKFALNGLAFFGSRIASNVNLASSA